jgi:hypothetical protein
MMTKGTGQSAEGSGVNIAEMVRNLAAAHGFIRKRMAVENLDLTVVQVDAAFRLLKQQGFLKRLGHGTYEYMHKPMDGTDSPVEDKVWRAMRMSPTFSVSELARVAGTTSNYVYKLFKKYRPAGLVDPAGRQTALSGFREKRWRLSKKGKRYRERPRLNLFVPDPLIMKVVALNKLVCTGMAMRCGEENRKALQLCGEISEGLQGLTREKGDEDAGDA